ncbi:MAG: D-2-hydroxyacid dehydrogenase [Campylobacteraceae bacterium]|jgi:glycerate dehydrogenase|nr:D-2-hydroxyacid dehydrogenase [Campylobacteraceae bacterium]
MKIVLLDAKTLGKDIDLSAFYELGEFTVYQTTKNDEKFERVKDADIVITNKVIFDREFLEQLPKLKLIALTATGMNNVNLEAAKEFGVIVKNVAGYSTKSVAQHTIMLALALVGRLEFYDSYVKKGKWCGSRIFTNLDRRFYEIDCKNWGIIGLGAIGKEVAKIASVFGAKVSYFSTSDIKREELYPRLSLDELLQSSDIITIHAPLNERTKNLIAKRELALLKQDAVIINTGRGGIVNEVDLAEAIENEKIYAASDVLEIEPMRVDSPLANLTKQERFIITPHVAWGSVEARERLMRAVYENIKIFMKEGR